MNPFSKFSKKTNDSKDVLPGYTLISNSLRVCITLATGCFMDQKIEKSSDRGF